MSAQNQNLVDTVAMANVIIINDHVAVVIKYDEAVDEAPVVVAKGTEEMALQIKIIGTEKGVYIVHNLSLADALYSNSKVEQCIPEELYASVAEMIAKVARSKSDKSLVLNQNNGHNDVPIDC